MIYFCILVGALIGIFVAVFGMWAYLKGQKNALIIKNGGVGENLFNKKPKVKETGEKPTFQQQLAEMFKSERGE